MKILGIALLCTLCVATFFYFRSSKNTNQEAKEYSFKDPENTACISCIHVLSKTSPILYVTHDEDDGAWQFLCGGDHTEADAKILTLRQIVDIDPSVNRIHDMPLGFGASREKVGGTWKPFKQ